MAYTTIRFSGDYPTGAGEVSGAIIGAPLFGDTGLGGYATTLGGVTFGIVPANIEGASGNLSTGYVGGDDIRLRGRWRRGNGAAQRFRIDLPAGSYRVIIGAAAHSYQRGRWRILDGLAGTSRLDFSWSGGTAFGGDDPPTTFDQWIDQNGTVRAIGADALTGVTPVVVSIASGVLELINGEYAGGAFSSDLSFIAFELVAAVTPTVSSITPTSGPVGTQVTFTGTNLAGTSAASFNGTACTDIINDSATQVRATVGAATTTGALALTATAGSLTGGPTFTVAAALVANAFRFVSPPDPIVAGTPYTITVEAIDTTQGSVRVTNYTGNVTLSIDTDVPVGYTISSGTLTQAAVAGLATFTSIVFSVAVIPPVVIPPGVPVISVTRRIIFTSTALTAQTDLTNISTALTARIADLMGATDTSYVTPVKLSVKRGAVRLRGATAVTPVAGIVTFPANTLALELDYGASASEVQLGLEEMFGVTTVFSVASLPLVATVIIDVKNVREGAAIAVVQVVGPVTGGNIQLQGTLNGINWDLIEALPYVGATALSTFTSSFFGRANVTGMKEVRIVKSVVGVTMGAAILSVTEG